jgi:hypothetical protein
MKQGYTPIAGMCLLPILVGTVLIYGAHRRWRWLVDPPVEWWPFYSQALIKKLLGANGSLYFTYLLGFLFLVSGLYFTCVFSTSTQ